MNNVKIPAGRYSFADIRENGYYGGGLWGRSASDQTASKIPNTEVKEIFHNSLPPLPKFPRRHPLHLLKNPGEIISIVQAALSPYFINGLV